MKRSKALKEILKICKEWESSKPTKKMANEILTKLELNMKPSIFKSEDTYQWFQRHWDEE